MLKHTAPVIKSEQYKVPSAIVLTQFGNVTSFTPNLNDKVMGLPLPDAQRLKARNMKDKLAYLRENPHLMEDFMKKL